MTLLHQVKKVWKIFRRKRKDLQLLDETKINLD
jgi:hypothetical protein